MDEKVTLTDDEWRQRLTPEQYSVLRKASTERPFTGQYVHVDDKGVYTLRRLRRRAVQLRHEVRLRHRLAELLRAAQQPAPSRSTGTGACSSRAPRFAARSAAATSATSSLTDPQPTGQRYCMNSCALKLDKSARLMPLEPSARARAVLEQTFGFADFRPGQADVVAASRSARGRALRRADRLREEHRATGSPASPAAASPSWSRRSSR